jgi:hypothetical protein
MRTLLAHFWEPQFSCKWQHHSYIMGKETRILLITHSESCPSLTIQQDIPYGIYDLLVASDTSNLTVSNSKLSQCPNRLTTIFRCSISQFQD